MHRSAIVIFLVAVFSMSHSAQSQDNTPTHQHIMPLMPPVIDGAAHPELIPDLTAYRLYLVMVSRPAAPTDNEVKRQNLQIAKVGLQDSDSKALVVVLTTFHSEYQSLVQAYNEEATEAWNHGEKPDAAPFLLRRDQLVESTLGKLKATLTPNGWERLDAHVHNEKRRMKVNAKEEVQ